MSNVKIPNFEHSELGNLSNFELPEPSIFLQTSNRTFRTFKKDRRSNIVRTNTKHISEEAFENYPICTILRRYYVLKIEKILQLFTAKVPSGPLRPKNKITKKL